MPPTSPPPPCPLPLQDIEDAASASAASASAASFGSVAILDSCTGCMSCRVLAPEIFLEARKTSADPTVFTEVAQGRPLKSLEEAQQVREAIIACPVHAIKWVKRPRELKVRPLTEGYPKPVSVEAKENVYLAGVPSKKLFGGASYLILGGGSGKDKNMLIDTPDCDEALVQFLRERGKLEYIVFTHVDHVGVNKEWKQAFPDVQRVMHADDFPPGEDTLGFEIKLQGSGDSSSSSSSSSSTAPLVCSLPGWEEELQLIHGPGHTSGSIYIIYKNTYLFTGDSLYFSRVVGHLIGARLQCWESWSRQEASWQQLLLRPFPFLHVLPGHGEPHRFASIKEAHASLEACLEWAKKLPDGYTPMRRFQVWVMTRTMSKRRWLRWVVDNMVLPTGAKLAIPLYWQEEGKEGGKEGGRKAFLEVSSSGPVVVMVGVMSLLLGVGVGLAVGGGGGGGGRGRRGGGRR